ncbi:unnamed protein product [Blepharisma stoltei]|uniref:Uncharacterized protein n=1 Tax=Blepharisma stoltei TaxID=1481888 RepID=A0AAU9J9P4_9CILI|nr:unnamed protein product [Blepharisma stoltei]
MSKAFQERFKTKSSIMSKSGDIDIDTLHAINKSELRSSIDSARLPSNPLLFPPIQKSPISEEVTKLKNFNPSITNNSNRLNPITSPRNQENSNKRYSKLSVSPNKLYKNLSQHAIEERKGNLASNVDISMDSSVYIASHKDSYVNNYYWQANHKPSYVGGEKWLIEKSKRRQNSYAERIQNVVVGAKINAFSFPQHIYHGKNNVEQKPRVYF